MNCFDGRFLGLHCPVMRPSVFYVCTCFGILLGASSGFSGSVLAQTDASSGNAPEILSSEQSSDDTRTQADIALDRLFLELREARSPGESKDAEVAIVQTWLMSGSDTVDILMTRTIQAMQEERYPVALDLLDSIITLKPDYAEGWNKRATVYFLTDDYQRSLSDIQRVLALEPRHFGALSGLGLIMQNLGDDERALFAFKRALEVHPRLKTAKDAVADLEEKLSGQDL